MYFTLTHVADSRSDGIQTYAEESVMGLQLLMSKQDCIRLNEPAQIKIRIETYVAPIVLDRGE